MSFNLPLKASGNTDVFLYWFWRELIFTSTGITSWVTSVFINSRSLREQVECETCSGNHYSAVSGIFHHPGEYTEAEGLVFAKEETLELGSWVSCLESVSFILWMRFWGKTECSPEHTPLLILIMAWMAQPRLRNEMRFKRIALFSESWNRSESFFTPEPQVLTLKCREDWMRRPEVCLPDKGSAVGLLSSGSLSAESSCFPPN